MEEREETLFEFPCPFSVKAMGLAADDFDALVVSIISRHVPGLGKGSVQTQSSSGGKYLSVTVTITARSRAQLDALYTELSQHERVAMVL